LYVKSDVYGFGVVLLEMLTGLRAMDTRRPADQLNLVDWAKPLLADRRRLARLVDPRLEGQCPSKAAAQLTLRCLANDPRSRPSMAEVVASLEDIERIRPRPEGESSRSGHGQHNRSTRSGGGSDGRSSQRQSPTSSSSSHT
jgi:serine/threonine protein kinase